MARLKEAKAKALAACCLSPGSRLPGDVHFINSVSPLLIPSVKPNAHEDRQQHSESIMINCL